MLELLEALARGLLLLGRLILEAGAVLDLSLRLPGRWLLRCLWPPHWFRPRSYHAWLESAAGIVCWLLLVLGLYYLDQTFAI
ncbi:MAG: hypothetical protein CMK74_09315 [Pseudomonadales bacterium]|nr:hypothetical protein [Pseudomonadales bacterium]|tara:strand:- start:867 stop:1112 length:246 start_codon:yes stop_codon:yes gene_type:complete